MTRRLDLVMVCLDLDVHQVLDLHGIEVAPHHHPQVIGNELHHVMVARERRVLAEYRAVLGILNVVFDGHQPFLAYLGKHLEKHRQQVDIKDLRKLRAFEDPGQRADSRLDDLEIIGCDKATNGQADDRDVLEGYPQRGQAAVHRVGPECCRQNDNVANDQKHPVPLVIARRQCRLAQISIVAHCSEIPHLRQRTRRLADDRTTDSRFPADPNHI